MTIPGIGRIGIWSMELRFGDAGAAAEAVTELDELDYGALWIPGAMGGDLLDRLALFLSATNDTTIASGILNIWMHEAADVAAWFHALSAKHRARFLLGLGVSHGATVGEAYRKPLSSMRDYLMQLAEYDVPADHTILAALGPKMLELAGTRTIGAHPYLVTPEHTAIAREALGDGPVLAPEQGIVLHSDRAAARDLARPYVAGYGRLENYANSWRRLGFSEDDIAQTSDRLVDAVFACGDESVIAARVQQHFDAGADHVCLQVVGAGAPGANDIGALRPVWRHLAQALISTREDDYGKY